MYAFMKKRVKARVPFTVGEVRSFIYQLLRAVSYIHRHGYFHRDVKPENIMVKNEETIKLGDFGLIRENASSFPYTDYVSTRWYRAPECIMRSD